METLLVISIAVNALLCGLAVSGGWIWRERSKQQVTALQELAKVKVEFADTTRKAAEVSQSWAVAVGDFDAKIDRLQDQISAIKMGLQGAKRG